METNCENDNTAEPSTPSKTGRNDSSKSEDSQEYCYDDDCDYSYDDGEGDEFDEFELKPGNVEQPFKFFENDEQIFRFMESEVTEVMEFVGKPNSVTLNILRKFCWDKMETKRKFLCLDEEISQEEIEASQESLLSEGAGICKISAQFIVRTEVTEGDESDCCKVCYSEISEESPFVSIGCDHFFCIDCYAQCWTSQLKSTESKPNPFNLRCMHPDRSDPCLLTATPSIVKQVYDLAQALAQASASASGSATLSLTIPAADKGELSPMAVYNKWLRLAFIEEHRHLQACASCGGPPECTMVIVKANAHDTQATDEYDHCLCRCGHSFCFGCGSTDNHAPAQCSAVKDFRSLTQSGEGAILLMDNTKQCPKCSMGIEKNEGCNHMRCRSCSHEFCWVCLQHCPRHEHPLGGCNKASKDSSLEERLRHYHKHFLIHEESETLERKNLAIERQRRQQETEVDLAILAAMETLRDCRRTLKYSYVHVLYLSQKRSRAELDLFECQQQDLENHTERLSGLVSHVAKQTFEVDPRLIRTRKCPRSSCSNEVAAVTRKQSIYKCPKCEQIFCWVCLKALSSFAEHSCVPQPRITDEMDVEALEGLRNHQRAALKFLDHIMQGASAENLIETGSGAAHGDGIGDEGSLKADMVHTSWYCGYCKEPKKACTCAVSQLMALGWSDRTEVERAVGRQNGDLAKSLAVLEENKKRKREMKWEERHDWFAGLR